MADGSMFVRVNGFTLGETARLYLKSALCTAWFRMRGVQCSLVACDGRRPLLYTRGRVIIGNRFIIKSRIATSEIGAGLRESRLEIGDRVFINQGCSVIAYCHIEIGDDTKVGEFVAIYDTNHHVVDPDHPEKSAPVVIGKNVWLGRGAMVLPGSTIGDHSVIAAGSIVRGKIPPRVLAVGRPAKVVRELNIPEGWRRE